MNFWLKLKSKPEFKSQTQIKKKTSHTMVRRKYLINLIALYGLINTINSANGELFFMIKIMWYRNLLLSSCITGDHYLLCPSEENGWKTVKWFKKFSNRKTGSKNQLITNKTCLWGRKLVCLSVFVLIFNYS